MAATGGPSGLKTQVDIELQGLGTPTAIESRAAAEMQRRAAGARASRQAAAVEDLSLTWDDLKQRHPCYMGEFWEECRALYAGGHRLLGSAPLMARLFPSNLFEDQLV